MFRCQCGANGIGIENYDDYNDDDDNDADDNYAYDADAHDDDDDNYEWVFRCEQAAKSGSAEASAKKQPGQIWATHDGDEEDGDDGEGSLCSQNGWIYEDSLNWKIPN